MIPSEEQLYCEAVHILNGDMLLKQLQEHAPEAEYIVFREALIEGAVCTGFDELISLRSQEIHRLYGVDPAEYLQKTSAELTRITHIGADRKIMLWFENDLFCQANLWFLSTVLSSRIPNMVCRVFPSDNRDAWTPFSISNKAELFNCFATRLPNEAQDFQLASALWQAYCLQNESEFDSLKSAQSNVLRNLNVLIELLEYKFSAQLSSTSLAQRIRQLPSFALPNFSKAFWEFQATYPEYGFGDLQFKHVWQQIRDFEG